MYIYVCIPHSQLSAVQSFCTIELLASRLLRETKSVCACVCVWERERVSVYLWSAPRNPAADAGTQMYQMNFAPPENTNSQWEDSLNYVWCSCLQWVAVCFLALQWVAGTPMWQMKFAPPENTNTEGEDSINDVCWSWLQCVAMCCSNLQAHECVRSNPSPRIHRQYTVRDFWVPNSQSWNRVCDELSHACMYHIYVCLC